MTVATNFRVPLPPARNAILALVLLASAGIAGPARALDLEVDRTDDDPAATQCTAASGDCSLRGAVIAANAVAPAASTITVPAGTYVLSQATTCSYQAVCAIGQCPRTQDVIALCIAAPVTITGAGASTTVLDGNFTTPIALVSAGVVATISDLTMTRGRHETVLVTTRQVGGAVINHGTLTIADSLLTNNAAVVFGGAIYSAGALTVQRSTISFNTVLAPFDGEGGGIFGDTGSSLTVEDSTVANNDASANGGGVSARQANLTLRGSTVSDNFTTYADGGGVFAFGPATLVLESSTLSGNHAGRNGGGLQVNPSVEARLRSVTVAANTGGEYSIATGGGVNAAAFSTIKLRNTLIAGNAVLGATSAWPDLGCNGATRLSEGYNLIGDPIGCALAGDLTGNLNGDPLLGPLGDNGGATATHALGTASPAIDAGDPAACTDDAGTPFATDQRGLARSGDGDGDGTARCDIGAFEAGGGGPGGGSLAGIQPREGGDAGSVTAIIRGSGFSADAVAKLVRTGSPDVVGAETTISGNGTVVTTRFALAGVALGSWDVVVANGDGSSASLASGFTVSPARAPDLWVEVVGPEAIRARRPTRYLLRYGNRGNTDAFAVPLLFAPSDLAATQPRFAIAPPPQQPGAITTLDFGRYYQEVIDKGEVPATRTLSLLAPVVPAGSSTTVEMILVAASSAVGKPFSVGLEITAPLFDGVPDASAVARLVQGARAKAGRIFAYTLPTSVDAAMAAYTAQQIESVVLAGTAAYRASGGADPSLYSLSQLTYDIAAYGLVASQTSPSPLLASATGDPLLARAASSGLAAAAADLSCACGKAVRGLVCCPGCLCPPADGKEVPDPPKSCLANLDEIGKPGCRPPETPFECRELGFEVVQGQDKDGNPVSVCTNNPRCIVSNPVGGNSCIRFPVRPVISTDPNDKTGPIGGGIARAIRPEVPLAYTIRFENQPSATAPAAEVVITDQLDPALVDLDTLTLGPVGFGTTLFVPPPGSTSFTSDIDLRPANDLIVRVTAALEEGTDVLTWRFTALDPATMEPPVDALAGFLPPNLSPPDGDGYVSFSVAAQPALPSGAVIANGAEIVFDENDPIVTPVWSNTIDSDAPTSQIVSIAPVGTCTQDLAVAWSGSDPSSTVAQFVLRAGVDGGPLATWLASDATSGVFHGRWGGSYVFQSSAVDAAGNVEAAPAPPSGPVVVPDCGPFDLAVTKIAAPKKVKLTAKRPARTATVKVSLQNRSAVAQTIPDAATLAQLVSLELTPLAGGCPAPQVVLHDGRPQKPLPFTWKSKQTLSVAFDVVLDCAVDPAKGAGHEDFSLQATVDQTALGGSDAHPEDDACPRPGVKPPPKDPFPNGKLAEKGCGAVVAGIAGGPVLIDVER